VRSRRLPPLVLWLGIAVVCGAVIGGSFSYASSVGDPLVREEAARKAQARPPALTPLESGTVGDNGGVSGPGGTTVPSSGGIRTFSLAALGIDPATTLPPSACIGPLARVSAEPDPTQEAVGEAWTIASDCAITQGFEPIDLDHIVADPALQPCVATFLTRETLRLRSPGATTRGLDRLVQTCILALAAPGAAGTPKTATSNPATGATPDPAPSP
jgi:hypothetical protein